MRSESLNGGGAATIGHGRNGAKFRAKTQCVKSDVDDGDWFSVAARQLHPEKPGTILHLVTGLGDERLCQKYAAGHVRPPAYFLRALLRSESGEQWLNALMEGCGAEWWARARNERRVGASALAAIVSVAKGA